MAEKNNHYRLLKDVSFLEHEIDANLHHIFLVSNDVNCISFLH